MKLYELLKTLSREQLVGVWNIDNKRTSQPTPQQYSKVDNLRYGKLRDLLEYDVMGVYVQPKNNGLLIKVYKKDRVDKSLEHWDLVDKFMNRMDKRK